MAFSKRQEEDLNAAVELYKAGPAVIRLQVNILPYRQYTREFGKGIDIVVVSYECYEEADYRLTYEHISRCQENYTALEKGKEIARWLVEQGVPRDKVRLRQGRPDKEIKRKVQL